MEEIRAQVIAHLDLLASSLCEGEHSREVTRTVFIECLRLVREGIIEEASTHERAVASMCCMMLIALFDTVTNNPMYDDHAIVDQLKVHIRNIMNKKF